MNALQIDSPEHASPALLVASNEIPESKAPRTGVTPLISGLARMELLSTIGAKTKASLLEVPPSLS